MNLKQLLFLHAATGKQEENLLDYTDLIMLDIKLIIENPDLVKARLLKKGYEVDFTDLIKKDADKRALQYEIETLKAERNKVSSQIPALKKQGLPVENIFAEMRTLGDKITEGDAKINALQEEIFNFVAMLPNLPDDDLLEGEKENNKLYNNFCYYFK